MVHSEMAELDSMGYDELRALARRQGAEISTLRALRHQDRTFAAEALRRIQDGAAASPLATYGCPSEAH